MFYDLIFVFRFLPYLFLIVLIRGSGFKIPRSKVLEIWRGGLLAVGFPFACLFWSEQRVSAGLAGILNGTVPIWTALAILAYQLKKDRKSLDVKVIAGLLLGFFGLWNIFAPRIQADTSHSELSGVAGLLVMALSYATSNVLNRKILMESKNLSLETLIFHQHFISFLFVMFVSSLFESWPPMDAFLVPKALITTVYLGVIASAAAYMIYFYLLKQIGAYVFKPGV